MKKNKDKTIVAIVVVALLVAVGVVGAITLTRDPLVGTWYTAQTEPTMYDEDGTYLILQSNHNAEMVGVEGGEQVIIYGTWEATDTVLSLTMLVFGMEMTIPYDYVLDVDALIITDPDGNTLTFTRLT